MTDYPKWATEKQREGMQEFLQIADEYGDFKVTFEQDRYESEKPRFSAIIEWTSYCGEIERKHKFDIGWNYERTWDCYGEETEHWQFIFSNGDATREMTTEIFFIDLFFALDKLVDKAA